MAAEYQPQTGNYYYYTSDQIGSTRIVTDDAGNIVYATAHDHYGGMQQTWVNAFNPELKFSGKEQDTESGLYYFGARYYDPSLYRFLSPDPVIPTDRALYSPQRWNLYAYCLGNPLNYADGDGKYSKYVHLNLTFILGLKVGLPTGLALRIAQADQRVDENWKTSSFNLISGFYLHFPNVRQFERSLDIALSTYDPEVLGMALHTIQDFFSHTLNGYSLSTGGHFLASSLGLDDPDDPWRDLERLSLVAEITEMILEEYKRRLTTLLINISLTIFTAVLPCLAI